MAQPIRFPAVVEQVTRHTPDVISYRLRANKRLPRFTPGQFIHLTMEPFDPASFWPESRVFSVANAVTDRRTVELTISRQGAYTSKILDQLAEGDQVWAKGPYGEFTIDGSQGRYPRAVLIAGGTGITPFCAFMDAAISQGALPVEQASLYYGAQTPSLLVYRALAERCAAAVPGFRAYYFAEQDADIADQSVHPGRMDLAAILRECDEPDATAFYISGPKPMIDAFRDSLVSNYGLSTNQVVIDAWE
jgi:ferredoxin-NADP reductase